MTQNSDGLFVRYTGAELLKEINIVDTPGTNVILQRQQQLTEEFIPRADLVLFVLSADRPFTDSEVKFLKYVREWGKKVVFVVNKIDLLANSDEIREVQAFVEDNARRLLSVDGALAFPVSAKRATEAKLECRYALGDTGRGILTVQEQEYLSTSSKWQASRFEELECHVRDFLLGGSSGEGSESVKLKLQTPLFVAEALLDASRSQLESELKVLKEDARSISMIDAQMKSFRNEMLKEGTMQKTEVQQQANRMVSMISSVIDQVMQFSNWQALIPYLNKKQNRKTTMAASVLYNQGVVSKDAIQRVNDVLDEHENWLQVNCERVTSNYTSFVEERMAAFGQLLPLTEQSEEERRKWRDSRASTLDNADQIPAFDIDIETVGASIENEIQEAVVSSASTAASAGGLALLLTYLLPTTLEDLLAVGLSAAIGYASLLNIPVRRIEAKKKIEQQVDSSIQAIHLSMDARREAALEACIGKVNDLTAPLNEYVAAEMQRVESNLDQLSKYSNEMEEFKKKISGMQL